MNQDRREGSFVEPAAFRPRRACDVENEGFLRDIGEDFVQILKESAWFGTLSQDALLAVASGLKLVTLSSGEVLFSQGEIGDSLYLLISGRLRILLNTAAGTRVVGELGQGEVVGEMALLSDEPRSATILATRDTQLARLDKSALERLSPEHRQQIDSVFIRQLVARLRSETLGNKKRKAAATSICVLPLSAAVSADFFCASLARAFGGDNAALRLDGGLADEYSGIPGACQSVPGDALHARLATWLCQQEARFKKLIYQADVFDSPWTSRCIRQADIVLLLANPNGDLAAARGRSAELLKQPGMRDKRRVLVLLHPENAPEPTRTKAWVDGVQPDRHFHVRPALARDIERLARFIDGRSVGLTLGAGFARGTAHVGVIRAMRELGIPIDMVGGTSVGAIVGGQCAMDWDCGLMLKETCERSIKSLRGDYTLPMVALLTGAKQHTAVEGTVKGRDIEDTWLPYFCISASLTRLERKVHTSGSAAAAIMASSRVPGIFPPLDWNGELLVDGGLVDMVPIDVMRDFTEGGIVIAVDVSPGGSFEQTGYGYSVSGWKQLWNRLNPFSKPLKAPGFIEVLMRTVEFGRTESKRAHALADAYLTVPLENFNFRDFNRGIEISEIGYRFALEHLSEWKSSSGSPWASND